MLAGWIRDHNITSTAVNSLLHILHCYHPGLPMESNGLPIVLCYITTRTAKVKAMSDGGAYSHIGIAKNLNDISDSYPNEQLKIKINVDGIGLAGLCTQKQMHHCVPMFHNLLMSLITLAKALCRV